MNTLREFHDEAIRTGQGWFVHDGIIELVPQKEEDSVYNKDVEQRLLKLGVTWIWLK